MTRSTYDEMFSNLFAKPRFRRREMLAFCEPPVATKSLQNWVDRGLFDDAVGLGGSDDLRALAAALEANEARGPNRLWTGFDGLRMLLLSELSRLGLSLALIGELAPLVLRLARSRLAGQAGDPLARWAAALLAVLEISCVGDDWHVELLPQREDDGPRPYLVARLDVGAMLDDLLPRLGAEPPPVRPRRSPSDHGECHAHQ